ncbi:ABC transporter substrate-binding protein [Acidaminobacter hydrogenoformans]|uniref:Carbohydrate ABC transporter substrate-binding protein, CUT1 family n=1 Tax=Acidaminobacter hydrogenoformans DSM 2784 TaxID=1120920 RepID=A0A1G5RSQ0_9FIRM|nr:ABC transporter substrate-binding protein [Acidaminobacter hydrogenoformans]SCZ77113.1 carbohydrate ABC transporter substrate-binding protein, CUT1 family [Acidaminobacter hydrogenoformans DSM 2784]
MKKNHIILLALILTSAIAVNFYYFFNRTVTLQFYAHPDKLGVMEDVIAVFENENPRIKINYVQLPDDTNDKYAIISSQLSLQNGSIDVLDADVTWPSIFVKSDWVANLDDYFNEDEIGGYLKGSIDSATVGGKLYGIPYRIDSGVLFYRKDLLMKYGYPVPKTYAELIDTASAIKAQAPELNGFSASWKNFEGLTCSFFEMLWSGGYEIDTSETPYRINAAGVAETLDLMQSMISRYKIVPEASLTYSSGDLRAAFIEGNLIFMRDWPTGWRKLSEAPALKDKIAVAPLPSTKPGHASYGALGGWMYMVSKDSKHKKEAVQWIKFLTTYENEKLLNLKYNYIPSRIELYSDEEVLERMPFLETMLDYFNQSRPRPKVANYDELSLLLQNQIHHTLKGEQTPEAAVMMLESLLPRLLY